ncbi:MAG: DUF4287 domain-containing protein [Robiginitalea sp.]|uniref:DUF4287 domain-containing protein n=1 Tax=Robiginitalea sp. TaxID=1902411 RepID=UPI003C787CD1
MDPVLKTMIENMPEKTGKSLEEWKKILSGKSFSKHSEAVNFLKQQHGVTHGFANTIVTLSKDTGTSEEDLVKSQYNGKESLIPIYEKILEVVQAFGPGVQVVPKKTTVSLVRKKQFALIKPATKTRIDLGLKLREKAPEGRLENSGPFGTMCTHRVRLEDVEDVDQELQNWLVAAYEEAQ